VHSVSDIPPILETIFDLEKPGGDGKDENGERPILWETPSVRYITLYGQIFKHTCVRVNKLLIKPCSRKFHWIKNFTKPIFSLPKYLVE
jgi:hypothetical protein